MNTTARDAAYYGGYTPIRNLLRKFDPLSVLLHAIRFLVKPTEHPVGQVRKQAWAVLMLVKWAFIDEQATYPGRRPPITESAFRRALQQACALVDRTAKLSEYDHVSLFLRTIAFQQFLYQRKPNSRGIARQEVLFAEVPDNHWFRTRFLEETGVSVGDFIRLSFALWSAFIDRRIATSEVWMSTLHSKFPKEVIAKFFSAVSVDAGQLHARLRADDKTGRKSAEYFEQTPFLSHPLVKVGQAYCCTHFEILVRSLEHFVYDTLKKADVNRFNAGFGPRFERYVGRVLSYAGSTMMNEDELGKALSGKGGVVDFFVLDGETNFLLDAKGVEMAARGKVAHLREVVLGATKTSLVSAVRQAHEVQARLAAMGDSHPTLRLRERTFLLVVTYKELYIGNGVTLSDAVSREALDEILSKYAAEIRIPLERMYFLTVEELEFLIEGVKDGKFTLTQALEHAVRDDAEPLQRKFVFSLHLAVLGAGGSTKLPALADAERRLTSDVEDALRE